jgi:hypothetical protein
MADSDVWTSPSEAGVSSEQLPAGSDLLSKTLNKVMQDFGSFLLGGVIPGVIALFGAFPAVLFLYLFIGLGAAPGMVMEDETTMMVGIVGGTLVGMTGMMVGFTAVLAPMQASLYRAVWAYLETGEKLTVGSAVSTFRQDLVRVILYQLAMLGLVGMGAMFCYVPGLLVAAALSFAGPAIYIHRLRIGEAISLSVGHLQRHPTWHLIYFLWSTVVMLVVQYIPFLGYLLVFTVHPVFVLMAYRAIFGNGALPRGYGATE